MYYYNMIHNHFINKYKPKTIEETHLSCNVKMVLQELKQHNNLNIILYGPSDCGKTTIVDTILKEYYETDNLQSMHQNILYINNLKEQGINYYRCDMKTFCRSKSTIQNKKKTIFIDDLDTINEQYQQIFRNYIDKYNENVQFICTCSIIQKIVESIQSRLMAIKIDSFYYDYNKNKLQTILNNENICINDECVEYILSISQNCIRNVVNNVEKLKLFGQPITIHICKKICFSVSLSDFDTYMQYINEKKIYEALCILHKLYDLGYSVTDILELFLKYVKICELYSENIIYEIIIIISKYIILLNKIHENKIELALFTYDVYTLINPIEDV